VPRLTIVAIAIEPLALATDGACFCCSGWVVVADSLTRSTSPV
jgi:hypothetical protein